MPDRKPALVTHLARLECEALQRAHPAGELDLTRPQAVTDAGVQPDGAL